MLEHRGDPRIRDRLAVLPELPTSRRPWGEEVFFRRKRPDPARDNPRLIANRGAGTAEAVTRPAEAEQLIEWRRSAQRVTRAWNAWLAAASRDHDARYRVFVAALADETRAAAKLERMIGVVDAGHRAAESHKTGLGAR